MSKLYIIATPIGNLEDITLRALRVLKEVDLVICEDTRVTAKLLNHYNIKKPISSLHQHSTIKKIGQVISNLKQGRNLAYVSDAGTPGVNDPGSLLVAKVCSELGSRVGIIPIPGPSAALAAVSISGLKISRFTFFGFPPSKKGRKKFFNTAAQNSFASIIYESKYRIMKTLEELGSIAGSSRNIIVARELTKKFETVYRGSIKTVLSEVKQDVQKGEYVIVVERK